MGLNKIAMNRRKMPVSKLEKRKNKRHAARSLNELNESRQQGGGNKQTQDRR